MQKQIFKVTKKSEDFEVLIKPTDNPNDVVLGIVHLLLAIEEHQKKKDPNYKIQGFINEIQGWVKELCQD